MATPGGDNRGGYRSANSKRAPMTIRTLANSSPSNTAAGEGPKNIRSLADLQNAIKKADHAKQQAQEQNKMEQQRRQEQLQLTKEERRSIRQSRKLTTESQQEASRGKIDTQISKFMQMMQTLEAEWQVTEEARIKREEEIEQQGVLIEKAASQLQFLVQSYETMGTRVNELKASFDEVYSNIPKSVKKEDKAFYLELKDFKASYADLQGNAIASNKYTSTLILPELAAVVPVAAIPSAPALPSGGLSAPKSNPVTSLLEQIKQGKNLKKLDPSQVEAERNQRKGNWRASQQLLQGLQDTLREALDKRYLDLFDDDDSDDEETWGDGDDE